ncbi:1-aminocyclopropane-1-carboxylate deaminase/D-cysteine desulfhydrase [Vibrio zhugei]|uniref:1-aminocyclopropane-1-carboxylate deaminase/D-cysteine desulfhydrase n=1 Tax=Vibrio zhugei TaxID=2479546 RepID=A0ABV7CD80_9VIBR|nr:1-aminocyclopropane-1-carboxylate deaminase/D-cysteine desulfhydrase [Vibrio zhugei]
MQLAHSPVTYHQFNGISFALKRDDLLHPQFSGNKARKLMTLLHTPSATFDRLISYGSAQANSLFSMAALAHLKGWSLDYYVDHIPAWLQQNPLGNYAKALELGANIISTRAYYDTSLTDHLSTLSVPQNACFIPEGGRFPQAEAGINTLAAELLEWFRHQPPQHWVVALPSGTGTSALYLHKALAPKNIQVVTCACVGGAEYLQSQWQELGETDYPTILGLDQKHHFGKLYPRDWSIWQQLAQETEIEFDLLYDPFMWQQLLEWWPKHAKEGMNLLYLHQGGQLGNTTMIKRYQRKYA